MADAVVLRKALKELGVDMGLTGVELSNYVEEGYAKEIEKEKYLADAQTKVKQQELDLQLKLKAMSLEDKEKQRQHESSLVQAGADKSFLSKSEGSRDSSPDRSTPKTHTHLHIEAYSDKVESIDTYLDRFERLATAHGIPEQRWYLLLAQGLRGRSYEVYAKLPTSQIGDYKALKQALLKRFDLNAEAYRKKFRNARKDKGESFSQFIERLDDYLSKWQTLSGTGKSLLEALDSSLASQFILKEIILLEQLKDTMSPDLKRFVAEQGAQTLEETANLAERFTAAQDLAKATSHKNQSTANNPKKSLEDESDKGDSGKSKDHSGQKYCTHCKTKTHNTVDCRTLKRKQGNQGNKSDQSKHNRHNGDNCTIQMANTNTTPTHPPTAPAVTEQVIVNGIAAGCLYDTGLSYDALVRKSYVDPSDIIEETVTLQGADKSIPAQTLPVAMIDVKSRFVVGKIKAAVMDNPLYDLILGCRYVYLGQPPQPHEVAAVQTRSQNKVSEEPKAQSNPLPQELKQAQETDSTLNKCFSKLPTSHTPPQSGEFFKKSGLLYRQTDQGHPQLVVPLPFRTQVLETGHSISFSGHMGIGATTQRITAHFYWPGITQDIQRHVKSCHQCQRSNMRHSTVPVALGEMPVTETPFQRVAIDLVGPLPLSKKRNRFILTLVDTCTMWSEAIPLPTIDSKRVAEALLSIFTRVGFPEEILTDNGSQFTGRLMQEVYEVFRANHVHTSPYHPQANGQVERFNGTLIAMLRKLVDEKPEIWDSYIAAALFAYREVPQASTGFSPAMMLFGRPIAGPLEVLKKTWTDKEVDETIKTSTQYVADLQARLQATWKIAAQKLKDARKKQAKYYNRHTKERELEVGEKALLLLPCGQSKLDLKWQGPYVITQKVSRTNYKIQVKGKDKCYHINLLKRYVDRPAVNPTPHLMALSIAEEVEDSAQVAVEFPLVSKETAKDAVLDPILPSEKAQEAMSILHSFPTVMSDKPGLTKLETVDMQVTDPEPVRSKPYPLPLAKQTALRSEVKTLLEAGIISPSTSPYSAGVVLLRKPSGEHRLCIDFRRLNAVTEFQAEPLPDVTELFAKLQGAKYFSRVDLSKGYYQIPVAPHVRKFLAFSTQDGHYEFNVLPFGLNVAPGIFSRMMRKLLGPLQCQFLHNFMDDILVATPTWEMHMKVLRLLLQRLKDTGLTARPTKCQIGFQELDFLGHTLRQGFIRPEDKNVEKMKAAARPVNKKDVRSFLGLCGFYQKYIPNFNQVAAPLSDLTKKAAPEKVVWTGECEQAYQALKEKISSRPVLQLPDPAKPFILRTDASNQGIGATLLQPSSEDSTRLHPVAYASRKLNKAETNYATIEKECLALVWAIQKFQLYLYGTHFKVQCDHQPLTALASSQNLNARLMRWSLLLQPYSFQVEYIPGKQNLGADFLSRHPPSNATSLLNPEAPSFIP